MSFFHTNSAAAARNRRNREKENHSSGGRPRTSSISSSSRRRRESVNRQENKSPQSKSPVLQSTIYMQQNLAIERPSNPALTDDFASALVSPGNRSSLVATEHSGIYQLSHEPFTPAALQQYLEKDTEGDEEAVLNSPANSVNLSSSLHADSPVEQVRLETRPLSLVERYTPSAATTTSDGRNVHNAVVRAKRTNTTPDIPARSRSLRASAGPTRSQIESHPEPHEPSDFAELSKQATSVSDPGAPAENFYKDAESLRRDPRKATDGYPRQPPQTHNKTSDPLRREEKHQALEDDSASPSPSQQHRNPVSRTFTPPAPQTPFAQPPATPPAYISPVPLRAQFPNDQYMVFQHPPVYNVAQQPGLVRGYYQSRHPLTHYPALNPTTLTSVKASQSQVSAVTSDTLVENPNDDSSANDRQITVESIMRQVFDFQQAIPNLQLLLGSILSLGETSPTKTMVEERTQSHLVELKEKGAEIRRLSAELESHKKEVIASKKLAMDLSESETQLEELKTELDKQSKFREGAILENAALKKEVNEVRRELQENSDKFKRRALENEALQKELSAKSQKITNLQQELSEARNKHLHEKETIQAISVQRTRELEGASRMVRDNLESALAKEQERLAVLAREKATAEESWTKERDALILKANEERQRLEKDIKGERSAVEIRWQKTVETQKKEHREAVDRLSRSHEAALKEERNKLKFQEGEKQKVLREMEQMNRAWEADKVRLSKVTGDFRNAATKFNEQNVNYPSGALWVHC